MNKDYPITLDTTMLNIYMGFSDDLIGSTGNEIYCTYWENGGFYPMITPHRSYSKMLQQINNVLNGVGKVYLYGSCEEVREVDDAGLMFNGLVLLREYTKEFRYNIIGDGSRTVTETEVVDQRENLPDPSPKCYRSAYYIRYGEKAQSELAICKLDTTGTRYYWDYSPLGTLSKYDEEQFDG